MAVQVRNKTNFHSIEDLAASDVSSTTDSSSHSKSNNANDSSLSLKVKMEPSPTQSLMTVPSADSSYHKPRHFTDWDGSGINGAQPPRSPAFSDDSGYGRDYPYYVNQLGIPYSDEESNTSHNDEESREARLRKVRKQRTVFETTQLEMLETTFNNNPYPSSEDYEMLANKINIDEARLRIWFQNRRARYRRSSKNIPSTILPTPTFPMPSMVPPHPLSNNHIFPPPFMMFGAHSLAFGGF